MPGLEICLVLLAAVLWLATVLVYFRTPIYEWLDNRNPYEPLSPLLRAAFRPYGRR
ncbi:hypothetical protein [Lichenicoccus sp.]|uniref:hypothetical protein n=1 Tax=Lichenicoccus sp. TaxID=2781899 RepID=UPI003D133DDC